MVEYPKCQSQFFGAVTSVYLSHELSFDAQKKNDLPINTRFAGLFCKCLVKTVVVAKIQKQV
jgi:hypothetical protein